MMIYCQPDPLEQIYVKFETKYFFIHSSGFENVVCKIAAILFIADYVAGILDSGLTFGIIDDT